MRNLLLVALLALAAVGRMMGQATEQEAKYYQSLTVKLYPDSALSDSKLVKLMFKMDAVLNANHSRINDLSFRPLILASAAGNVLRIRPQWEALSQKEREDVFDLVGAGLIMTQDLTVPATLAAPATPPAPVRASAPPFNPGSMNGDVPASDTTTTASPAASSSGAQATIAGFHYFLFTLESQGSVHGQKNAPVIYRGGPLSGMTEPQGTVYAQRQWEQLSPDQQMVYEKDANSYGDPIAQRDAERAAHPAVTGTIQNANTGEVQYVNLH